MVRCAYCHENGRVPKCPRCRTAIHKECRQEHGSCPVCGYKDVLILQFPDPPRKKDPLAVFLKECGRYPELAVGLGLLLVGLTSLFFWYVG